MPTDLRRAYPARPYVWWSVVAVLAAILVLLTIAVHFTWSPVIDIDDAVADAMYDLGHHRENWVDFWEVVSAAGSPWVLRVVLLFLAVPFLIQRQIRPALWLLISVAIAQLLAPFSKHLLDRPRPSWADALTDIGGYSYPSGHAMGAGMFATAMVLLTVVLTGRGPIRQAFITLWTVIGGLIVVDRLFLDVHYVSDVVAGSLLGVLVVLVPWIAVMGGAEVEAGPGVTATGTGARRIGVVFNPIKVGDNEVFRQRVREAAADAGWHTPSFYETTVDDPGTSMAHRALAAGVDMVLVAGGDGTVRIVCNELARTGVAVGVVPLGTGNLLARNLGIPLHQGDAIDVAFNGQDRAIDVAKFHSPETDDEEASDTSFTVMAGLGLDAAIMTGAPDDLKAKMGWLAYVVSAFRQLRYPAVKVEIAVDDGPFEKHRARTVVVGNVGQLQAGIPLLPDASIDDGELDVVVIAPPRALSWPRLIARVLTRRRRTDEKLARLTGRKVVVRAEKPTPRQLDGDPVGDGSEFTAEVEHGVLLIRVPS